MDSSTSRSDPAENLWFLNGLMKVCRSSHAAPDGVSIIEFRLPHGDSPPTHVHHEDDEIFHLIEGRMRVRVGDQEFVLEAGNTMVAPKGIPHTFRVESENGARGLNIVAGPNFENFVREMGRPAVSPSLPPRVTPGPELIGRLTACARRHQMEIVGPPM